MPDSGSFEFVDYYAESRWQSRRGKITIDGETLIFQSFADIVIPLGDIHTITLLPAKRIARLGIDRPELEFKHRDMLFLVLQFESPSPKILGEIERRTAVFGSAFTKVKQGNEQMELLKRAIYRARSEVLFEIRERLVSPTGSVRSREKPLETQKRGAAHKGWLLRLFH